MKRTWEEESNKYINRMREAYGIIEEAFDSKAFNSNPLEYFKSINYDLSGIDWIPAIWNLIKFAKADSNFTKGQFGPNGQKAIQIINTLISKNPELKKEIESAKTKLPGLFKKYGNKLESTLLSEAKIQNKRRLRENMGSKIKKGLIFLILALMVSNTAFASNVSKSETKYGTSITTTTNSGSTITRSQGSVTGNMGINCNNIASVLVGINTDVDSNTVNKVVKEYNLKVTKFSNQQNSKKSIALVLKNSLITGTLTDEDIQNICEAFGLPFYS